MAFYSMKLAWHYTALSWHDITSREGHARMLSMFTELFTAVSAGPVIKGTSRRPFRYERVYLPLYKVADTPFHI